MYQDRAAFNKSEATAEEYLLGKVVSEQDLSSQVRKQQQLTEAFTTTENEAFLKMKDDPLVQIKEMEQEQRRQVINNPMTLKRIREEIEALKNGRGQKRRSPSFSPPREKNRTNRRSSSRDRHARKRHREESSESDDDEDRRRRRKESRRERRRDDSESSRETRRRHKDSSRYHRRERSRRDSRDYDQRRNHHYNSRRDESSESSRERYYTRRHRSHRDEERSSHRHRRSSPPPSARGVDNQKLDGKKKDLGPDMSVYGDRLKEIREME